GLTDGNRHFDPPPAAGKDERAVMIDLGVRCVEGAVAQSPRLDPYHRTCSRGNQAFVNEELALHRDLDVPLAPGHVGYAQIWVEAKGGGYRSGAGGTQRRGNRQARIAQTHFEGELVRKRNQCKRRHAGTMLEPCLQASFAAVRVGTRELPM